MMNSVVFASLVGMMGVAGQAVAGNTGSSYSYSLMDDYNAGNWNSMFNYFTGSDPTHGLVDYISESAAQNAGLLELNSGAIYMGVDDSNVVGSGGRPSVRVTSNKAYNHGLVSLSDRILENVNSQADPSHSSSSISSTCLLAVELGLHFGKLSLALFHLAVFVLTLFLGSSVPTGLQVVRLTLSKAYTTLQQMP